MCNKQEWSPLIAAARYGGIGMVEMLLRLGADLHHRDEEGSTALHHAAAYGHLQTISLLIEKGSSSTIKNKGGWTPLDFAYSDKVSAHMEGTHPCSPPASLRPPSPTFALARSYRRLTGRMIH
ncbi:MAG: ankyrin repeat-containing domain protein [Benniella sp.]|nr:MAG: ankyrin repeat-containing domain protein [Benniella sp.]